MSGKIALIKRWIKILSGKNRVAIKQGKGRCCSKTEIAGYYNDLTGKVNNQTLLDEEGIPINLIEGNKKVYFPISVFQYALGLWDLYLLDKDDKYREHFLKLCAWIVDNQAENGSWNCFGPIGYKTLTVSSMGQGEAASVLVRAYKLTCDEKWLNAARKAILFMIAPVEKGGTLLLENNDAVLEEYADTYGDKKSVLNGWIFSIFGILDYLKTENNADVQKVYLETLETLKRNLKCYDCGYWSLYDRTGRMASPAYHDLHIELLCTLYDITGITEFKLTSEKWKKYAANRMNCLRAIGIKALQKLRESPEGIIIQ